MKITTRLVSALGLLCITGVVFAAPASFSTRVIPLSELTTELMPTVDASAAKAAPRNKPLPLRFALPIAVALSPDKAGQWETLPDGRLLWRAVIRSESASSLNLGFTRYYMPEGGELYFYSADQKDVRGPYGRAHNLSNQLWSPVIRGNEVVIEAIVPAGAREQLVLALTQVNHGFLEFWNTELKDKSGSCNIDVVCPQADAWRDEIRSVARFTISGQFLCSGQLVNNSRLDFTPYFLTANHCISTSDEAASTVYYWNYQSSACNGKADGKLDQTQSGAKLSATYAPSDFTLLELDQKPASEFKVYYAGWDSGLATPIDVTGIHHPSGDEKRISFSNRATRSTSYGGTGDGDGTHLLIEQWDTGTTEGGSSGSGLWNSEHRLVGQLHGGNAACDTPEGSDWYGRLAVSWTGGGNPENSLKLSLDPLNSAQGVLDGADPALKLTDIASDKDLTSPGRFGGALPLPMILALAALVALRRKARYSSSKRYLRNKPRN